MVYRISETGGTVTTTTIELKKVLGGVLSGKMMAPSPAFQKALIGEYWRHLRQIAIMISFILTLLQFVLIRHPGTKPDAQWES